MIRSNLASDSGWGVLSRNICRRIIPVKGCSITLSDSQGLFEFRYTAESVRVPKSRKLGRFKDNGFVCADACVSVCGYGGDTH